MVDFETWDSHDRVTGPYCSTCGSDSTVCGDCRDKARDAEWRAAVERVRGTIPRESDEFERALAAIGDAVLNNVLAAMEGR